VACVRGAGIGLKARCADADNEATARVAGRGNTVADDAQLFLKFFRERPP